MKSFRKATLNECLGACLQGTVSADYDLLVDCFGEPEFDTSDKTPAEWCIAFGDGTIATIYCWKTFEIPEGLWDWNIGGFGPQAVHRVNEVLEARPTQHSLGSNCYYVSDIGRYQILAKEDNALVWHDFVRIGETDSGIIRFSSRAEADAFIRKDTSEPHLCRIVEVFDDGDFLHVL